MQFAKDSVYMAMRERLAQANPERTVQVNGTIRPAIIAIENESQTGQEALPGVFYLSWGSARRIKGKLPLVSMDCEISYWTNGQQTGGSDRGRTLGALDAELLAMCMPLFTPKRDYTQSPAVDLGSNVFWEGPTLEMMGDGKGLAGWPKTPGRTGNYLARRALITVFFFTEPEAA